MDSTTTKAKAEIAAEYPPFLRIYTDGRIERLIPVINVPPSTDPTTGVTSADTQLCPAAGLSARLFVPPLPSPAAKLPILLHFHGGGFCIGSPYGPLYNAYLSTLSARTASLVVSVEYRLAPEHPLPAAYDDASDALSFIVAAGATAGAHPWLTNHGDPSQLFLIGDSAGANIAHRVLAMRTGDGVDVSGMVLCHPFFWGTEAVGEERREREKEVERNWRMVCPGTIGCDDPWLNPRAEEGGGREGLVASGCKRVLVCVAEMDTFRWRGEDYYDMLASGGWWTGVAELFLSGGEDHAFHIKQPNSVKTIEMIDRIASFLSR